MVSVAPPTVPSIIARLFCSWCFLLGIIISCGATIGGLDDASSNPPIVAPQLIIIPKRKHHEQNNLAIILGTVGGATLTIFLICISVYIYNSKIRYRASRRTSMYSLTSCLYS